jgi:hypothetical protein
MAATPQAPAPAWEIYSASPRAGYHRHVSVPVPLDSLRAEIARLGQDAYVLTVSPDGRSHSVSVSVSWAGDDLVMGGGTKTLANATDRPLVSLLWPPAEAGGYSLIVDGTARADDGLLVVRPTRAILHRRAPTSAGGSDCVALYPPAVNSPGR